MQARLSQLKEVINQFNGLNDETISTQTALNSTFSLNQKNEDLEEIIVYSILFVYSSHFKQS